MNCILCSTGAIIGRPNGRNFQLLRECSEKLTCDGFEVLMYEDWYDKGEEMKELVEELQLAIPVLHCEKEGGDLISRNQEGDWATVRNLFEKNCEIAQMLGADKLVLHLWSGMDSDKDIDHNIKCYAYLRDIAEKYGLLLTVENVVCNRQDPMTHMKSLVETYPDIRFTFDTKMSEFHSQTDALYAPENSWLMEHIAHFHINDYRGGHMDWGNLQTLHMGQGKVDFGRLFRFVRGNGYRGDFTVEATSFDKSGIVDFDALNATIQRIRSYIENSCQKPENTIE